MESRIYLSLGSNLQNKEENIKKAILELKRYGQIKNTSSLYYTKAEDHTEQDDFVNVACEYFTELSPIELVNAIKRIENELGRVKTIRYGPRIIDVDIIYYENKIVELPDLQIPHPRMVRRAFVIIPLYEIECDIVHPILKKTILDFKKEVNIDGILEVKPFDKRLLYDSSGH